MKRRVITYLYLIAAIGAFWLAGSAAAVLWHLFSEGRVVIFSAGDYYPGLRFLLWLVLGSMLFREFWRRLKAERMALNWRVMAILGTGVLVLATAYIVRAVLDRRERIEWIRSHPPPAAPGSQP